jgi:hypothetical protein
MRAHLRKKKGVRSEENDMIKGEKGGEWGKLHLARSKADMIRGNADHGLVVVVLRRGRGITNSRHFDGVSLSGSRNRGVLPNWAHRVTHTW